MPIHPKPQNLSSDCLFKGIHLRKGIWSMKELNLLKSNMNEFLEVCKFLTTFLHQVVFFCLLFLFGTLGFCMGKCVSLLSRLTLIIILIIRCTLNFGKCYKVFHQVYG